jgi:hypothetical protein
MLFLSFSSIHVSAFEGSITETINIPPIADAYVDSYHSDEKKGNDPSLWVTNYRYMDSSFIFIKFDLSSIPIDANIVSAQLKLYAGYVSNRENVSVHYVGAYYVSDDSWREDGITYNNRPTSIYNYTTHTGSVSPHSWCSWDITDDVSTAFRDDKGLTEALMWENTNDYGLISFYSKETAWSEFRPVLEITYTIPTSSTSTPTPSVAPEPTPTPTPSDIPLWKEFLTNPYLLGACIIITAIGTIVLILQNKRKHQH